VDDGEGGTETEIVNITVTGAYDAPPFGFLLSGRYAGRSVSSAGDVNNDGVDDILIGAAYDQKAYVVFGKNTEEKGYFDKTNDMANLDGSDGFVLNYTGYSNGSVSSAGDVNNDGVDDILIGARGANANGDRDAGNTYVVFGKNTVRDGGFAKAINLADLGGSDGFVFKGSASSEQSGVSVSSAGDVNGDRVDDILIGTRDETYVVFGGANLLADFDAADGVADGSIDLSSILAFI
jgi:hypothetical protein